MDTQFAPAFADAGTYFLPESKPILEHPHRVFSVHQFAVSSIQAYLMGEISDDLVVSQPLEITIEQDEDNTFVVSDDLFLVYGDGGNLAEAIRDYVESLIKYFQLIEKGAETNEFDKALLPHLHSYIQPRGYDAVQT